MKHESIITTSILCILKHCCLYAEFFVMTNTTISSWVSNDTVNWPLQRMTTSELPGSNNISILIPMNQSHDNPNSSNNLHNTSQVLYTTGSPTSQQDRSVLSLLGSFDAFVFIAIVFFCYTFSIVVLLARYVRRHRREADVNSYYHEFVPREKIDSPYRCSRHKQKPLRRLFGGAGVSNGACNDVGNDEMKNGRDEPCHLGVCGDIRCTSCTYRDKSIYYESKPCNNHKNPKPIDDHRNISCRLKADCKEYNKTKSKISNTFFNRGLFGKKLCNKQMCSKCVLESQAPTIDWDDGISNNPTQLPNNVVEIQLYRPLHKVISQSGMGGLCGGGAMSKLPINVESDRIIEHAYAEYEDGLEGVRSYNGKYMYNQLCGSLKNHNTSAYRHTNGTNMPSSRTLQHYHECKNGDLNQLIYLREKAKHTEFEKAAFVSPSSRGASNLQNVQEPLVKSNDRHSQDIDTLDGLSNLESEPGSKMYLNDSDSAWNFDKPHTHGSSNRWSFSSRRLREKLGRKDPGPSESGHLKDLNDFLSERTSLLSCTLSIANECDDRKEGEEDYEDELDDVLNDEKFETNQTNSSSKHENLHVFSCNGSGSQSIGSSCFGFPHEDSIGILNERCGNVYNSNRESSYVSKSSSRDGSDGLVMVKIHEHSSSALSDDASACRNLKHFLRNFTASDQVFGYANDRLNLLPKETCFGPGSGSPTRVFASHSSSNVSESVPRSISQEHRVYDLDKSPRTHDYIKDKILEDKCIKSNQFISDDFNAFCDKSDHVNSDENEDDDKYRWCYAYGYEDDVWASDGEKSSSFGDYCMGDPPSASQIIDLSKPLLRRDLDDDVKDKLSRAFLKLDDIDSDIDHDIHVGNKVQPKSCHESVDHQNVRPPKNTNRMIAGYDQAPRKETKV